MKKAVQFSFNSMLCAGEYLVLNEYSGFVVEPCYECNKDDFGIEFLSQTLALCINH